MTTTTERDALIEELRRGARDPWAPMWLHPLLARAADALEQSVRDSQRLDWMEHEAYASVVLEWACQHAEENLRAAIDLAMANKREPRCPNPHCDGTGRLTEAPNVGCATCSSLSLEKQ